MAWFSSNLPFLVVFLLYASVALKSKSYLFLIIVNIYFQLADDFISPKSGSACP